MYTVELKPQAGRFIEGQNRKTQRQLIRRIEALRKDPRPAGSKLLHAAKKIYRVRSGNYRIIYQIKDKKLLIIIVKVSDRKDIYRNLGTLFKAH
jgi:mRNA interferase RelE/StbE